MNKERRKKETREKEQRLTGVYSVEELYSTVVHDCPYRNTVSIACYLLLWLCWFIFSALQLCAVVQGMELHALRGAHTRPPAMYARIMYSQFSINLAFIHSKAEHSITHQAPTNRPVRSHGSLWRKDC